MEAHLCARSHLAGGPSGRWGVYGELYMQAVSVPLGLLGRVFAKAIVLYFLHRDGITYP